MFQWCFRLFEILVLKIWETAVDTFIKIFLLDSHALISSLFSYLWSEVRHLGHAFCKRILLQSLLLIIFYDEEIWLSLSYVCHWAMLTNFMLGYNCTVIFFVCHHLDFSIKWLRVSLLRHGLLRWFRASMNLIWWLDNTIICCSLGGYLDDWNGRLINNSSILFCTVVHLTNISFK